MRTAFCSRFQQIISKWHKRVNASGPGDQAELCRARSQAKDLKILDLCGFDRFI
jgi:hypothetical protein